MASKELPQASFAEIAVALLEECKNYAKQNTDIEVLSHKMAMAGLNEEIRASMIADRVRHIEMLADAHKVMRALADHEDEIREMLKWGQIFPGSVRITKGMTQYTPPEIVVPITFYSRIGAWLLRLFSPRSTASVSK